MKSYRIEITWMAPYPRQLIIQEAASSLPAAVARAMRQWRKENKGKKIKSGTIKFIQL